MKATVNFGNMNDAVLSMLSNCQLHITELSVLEKATDTAKEKARKAGKAGDDLKKAIEKERKAEKDAKEKTTTACEVFIIRNMTTEDVTSKNFDIYHINWDGFLKAIGVVSDGEVDKKATDKIKAIIAKSTDRYNITCAKRRRGEDKFTDATRKDVKNNIIDLVSAFIYACVDSGAIDYCGGGLAKVDFSKKTPKEGDIIHTKEIEELAKDIPIENLPKVPKKAGKKTK